MLTFLIRRLTATGVVWVLVVTAGLGALVRWASTTWGIFVVSLVAYWALEYSDSPPLSLHELLDWFISLEDGTQATILGGVLTVLGFVIAFRTAHATWINQKRIELALQIASDLDAVFSEAARKLNSIKYYADTATTFAEEVTEHGDSDQSRFLAGYLLNGAAELVENRKRVSQMVVEVHGHVWRYTALLSEYWGLMDKLREAADIVDAAAIKMWFPLPVRVPPEDLLVEYVTGSINVPKLKEFCEFQDAKMARMHGLVGEVRGQLMQPLRWPRLSTAVWAFKNRKEFSGALGEMSGKKIAKPRRRRKAGTQ